jgi:hypothetical protein
MPEVSTSGPCEMHLQARRATHITPIHEPPSGLEYSLLGNRLLTQPAFMFCPPGFDDEEFRQKDRTQKNRITEQGADQRGSSGHFGITMIRRSLPASGNRRNQITSNGLRRHHRPLVGMERWSRYVLALDTIPRRQATW